MKQLTAAGLRLISIWVFMKALSYIRFIPIFFTSQQDFYTSGKGMLIVFLIYIAGAGILFFKAPGLAVKISGQYEEPPLQISNYKKLAAVLFASVGLLIFFNALATFIGSIGRVYNDRGVDPQYAHQLIRAVKVLLFGGGIQMILGAGLFVGGKKIASWWYSFRNWT